MELNENNFIEKHLNNLLNPLELNDKIIICAFNKIDLLNEKMFKIEEKQKNIYFCKISCLEQLNNGIDELLNCLKVQISNM